MTVFRDLADLPVDERIAIACGMAEKGALVAIITDNEEDKIKRYRDKINTYNVKIKDEFDGPIDKTYTFRVGPRK